MYSYSTAFPKRIAEPSKVDMYLMLNLLITNFGPVAETNIHLPPLTILIGSNHSDKSSLAGAVYSILTASNQVDKESTDSSPFFRSPLTEPATRLTANQAEAIGDSIDQWLDSQGSTRK